MHQVMTIVVPHAFCIAFGDGRVYRSHVWREYVFMLEEAIESASPSLRAVVAVAEGLGVSLHDVLQYQLLQAEVARHASTVNPAVS